MTAPAATGYRLIEKPSRVVAVDERWLPIPGYEGLYEVSDQGRVRSLDRIGRHAVYGTRRLRGRFISLQGGAKCHQRVPLCKDERQRTRLVHRLVLQAFVGPCPDGMECCHNNGNPADNRLENLRWDTPSANGLDAVRHGTNHLSRKTHCPQGHEYTPENTRLERNGRARRCRICKNAESARRYARQKARAT